MAKKSLFNTFLNLFISDSAHKRKPNISANQAINIQNEYISANRNGSDESFPPYKEIMQQLLSDKTEVLQAAAYYIGKIALNEPDYTAEIVADLKTVLKKYKMSEANRSTIKDLIQSIGAGRKLI